MAKIAIVMGSKSDEKFMEGAITIMKEKGVDHEVFILSAHRQPEAVREFARSAKEKGFKVIIAGAGYAAHLPGMIAAYTDLPVLGVPLPTSDLRGVDSLLSIIQMPKGVPVATFGIGSAGAKNAALFALKLI
ncbi:5-(carboxyamino)imidazole ribonucleotide mutase [candidate division WOR-3 bacterium]|uniref:N5-carboxyaminoimidazole ribonucleotide mutase n=1 Tax=candidate division WOR-3 bacterium TaxID=2052148 RepID=A0A660SI17_UNCW3|nr:MAG: 5-(carboxyamino)imidazole ribonucleotide mutase [candidate division WOR-3 bacterium]